MALLQISGIITAYCTVLAAVLGAVFGSFLNCMAWRIAHHESVITGRSHCPVCGHVLGPGDLVPVFSWIFLKGKCRYCGAPVSVRYLLTEVFSAAGFVLILFRFDVSWTLLRYLVLFCILLPLSLVDLEIFEIPDRFIAAGILWWAVTLLPAAESGTSFGRQLLTGLTGGALVGGGMLLLTLLFDRATGKESMGGGDIKLFFMTGLYLGPAGALLGLILSCVLGLVFAAASRRRKIPFGPAISLSAMLVLLWGRPVIEWYMGFLS